MVNNYIKIMLLSLIFVGIINAEAIPINPVVIDGSAPATKSDILLIQNMLQDLKQKSDINTYNFTKRFDIIEAKQADLGAIRTVIKAENTVSAERVNDHIDFKFSEYIIISILAVIIGFSACMFLFRKAIFQRQNIENVIKNV